MTLPLAHRDLPRPEERNTPHLWTSLLTVLAIGILLRLIWMALIPVDPVSDGRAYWTLAHNLIEHGVYGFEPDKPSAYWAVGTPALYAFGFSIFGEESPLAVLLPNMISAIAVILLLYDLGRRWFSARVGVIAALLFAIWPLAIQFSTVLASEIHFMALSLAGLAAWERSSFRLRGLLFLAIAGLFLGAATYLRPIALLIPAALAIASLLRSVRLGWPEIFKAVVATAIVMALVAPWSARNERVFGEPVMMSTNFWANFWMGNNPDTTGFYMPLPAATAGLSEIEQSDYFKELATDHLREAPGAFVTRTIWKGIRLHERETIGVGWNEGGIEALIGPRGADGFRLISTGYWYAMLGLAFLGIWTLARDRMGWWVILAPPVWLWLYFSGIHAVIVVGDRYHMPAIPLIALLSAVGVSRLLPSRKDT